MTSKRSFANLLKESNKRHLWPIALSLTGNFFAQIVYGLLMLSRYADRLEGGRTTMEDVTAAFYSNVAGTSNGPVFFIMIILAVVIALQAFAYLFDSRQMDLYGSLPVKREKFYDVVSISGILSFVLPYIAGHLIVLIMGIVRGYVDLSKLHLYVASALIMVLCYVFLFEVCVLAAVLTGHVVVAALACGVFFGLGPVASFLYENLMSLFFNSYYTEVYRYTSLQRFSPLTLIAAMINGLRGDYENAIRFNFFGGLKYIVIILVLTIVLYIISRVLIKYRPAEAAGRAMAFGKTKAVIKIIIATVGSLSFGLLLLYMGDSEDLFIFLFGVVCGLIIIHAVMETIYEFDFKASFRHWGSLLVSAAFSFGIVLIFLFDVFGYESWQPMPSRVESIAIADSLPYDYQIFPYYRFSGVPDDPNSGYVDTASGNDFALKYMQLTDLEKAEKITRQGAINAKEQHKLNIQHGFHYAFATTDTDDDADGFSYNQSFVICWNMKDGRKIMRRYDVDIAEGDLFDTYRSIYESEEYKYGKFPAITMNPDEINYISCDLLRKTYEEKLSENEVKELIESYRKDVLALSFDEKMNERPVLLIYGGNMVNNNENNIYSMNVYPSFDNTLAFLKKHDFPQSRAEEYDQIDKLTIGYHDWSIGDDENADKYYTTEDKEEIRNIMENTVYGAMSYGATDTIDGNRFVRSTYVSINYDFGVETFSEEGRIFESDKLPKELTQMLHWDSTDEYSY